jgi:AraC family transcriptional regulator of adaptative response/methylated-DNA-[protein]-cysteine methyltransferase
MLLAATEQGVCAVQFGESAPELEQELRAEFPKAEIVRSDRKLKEHVRALRAMIDGQPVGALPLDLQATAFQRRVWEELQAIPRGTTRTYSKIAADIGNPKGARAVARACATNPVSIVIPCHRVVREDGSMGGYRWGIDRKKKLLALEAADSSKAGSRTPNQGSSL